MRVIAGFLGGREFQSPKSHRTHPMSERIRGALFNMLGGIEGLTVLDALAGSGALGFEAVSRGAAHVTLIETDKAVQSNILKNIRLLQIKDAKIKAIRANAGGWSENNPDLKSDIVLLDPPHDDIRPELLRKLAAHAKTDGVIVLSLPPNSAFRLQASDYKLITEKSYGDAELIVYRKIN